MKKYMRMEGQPDVFEVFDVPEGRVLVNCTANLRKQKQFLAVRLAEAEKELAEADALCPRFVGFDVVVER